MPESQRQTPPKASEQPIKTPQIYTQHSLPAHWTYLHLAALPDSSMNNPNLDEMTVRLSLLNVLSTAFGDHGAAVPIDILAVHSPKEIFIRVPVEDGSKVMAAAGEVFVVKGRSERLSVLVGASTAGGRSGQDLFDP
ncbi:MAG: hypothetical protein M1828_004232 [Chrysothrix sp. TS-e1954]|nr:MAG: hypothetical protein M1828_004232 [Chrysothrix sp. TS-e1954]